MPAAPTVPDGRSGRVDDALWSRWWRDLVVERYRVATFERVLPLADPGSCPWVDRVRLGRLVDDSLVGVHGPGATAHLLTDALVASGYGPPTDPDRDRRSAETLAPWNPMRAGDDDLRLGILGTIADALLGRDLPAPAPNDDVAPGSTGCESPVADVIIAGTRGAVLAYARHVEDLAERTRRSVHDLRDDHLRV